MKRISYHFGFGNTMLASREFWGPFVVSRDGIYLIPIREAHQYGGLQGLLMKGFLDGLAKVGEQLKGRSEESFESIPFFRLDSKLRALKVWGKDVPLDAELTFIPKSQVNSVKCSMFKGLRIDTTVAQIVIQIGPWGVAKARRIFSEYGWQHH